MTTNLYSGLLASRQGSTLMFVFEIGWARGMAVPIKHRVIGVSLRGKMTVF